MNNRLLVTIATYNEIENLPSLVGQLNQELPNASILVVDDDSPDGTADWVEEKAKSDDRLTCLRRTTERGLGSATIAGLKWGLERDYELIATMDADFSHPPASLVEMLDKIQSDQSLDVVIGSRYVPGGAIRGWPISRRIGSRIVNLFARFWLRLRTRDNSSALRIYRATSLAQIGLQKIKSTGYAYLEELLVAFHRAGANLVEHPFVFCDREKGRSKLSFCFGLTVFREIFWMRFRNYQKSA